MTQQFKLAEDVAKEIPRAIAKTILILDNIEKKGSILHDDIEYCIRNYEDLLSKITNGAMSDWNTRKVSIKPALKSIITQLAKIEKGSLEKIDKPAENLREIADYWF
jgi:hypothetical protein